jgi:hypothetical protein
MDRAGELDHFGAGRLKVFLPQFGVTGKTDPDGVVRGPFGGLAKIAHAAPDSDRT